MLEQHGSQARDKPDQAGFDNGEPVRLEQPSREGLKPAADAIDGLHRGDSIEKTSPAGTFFQDCQIVACLNKLALATTPYGVDSPWSRQLQ